MLQKFTKRKKSIAISAYPVSAGQDAESMQRNTKSSVENYSKRWFEYPYATATNVAEMKVEWNIRYCFLRLEVKTESCGELRIMNLGMDGSL
jgi:hypothetical protein